MTSSFDGMLPIREVARLTGVNAVTLRAWERRYGLIEPHRTEKGHRLYTQANIEQVRDILTWLARGVNVGQVKGLLEQSASAVEEADSPWGPLRTALLEALQTFDMSEFERRFARSRTRYSSSVLCAQLFEPVLESLHQRWQGQFGSQLEEVFFHGWLRGQVAGWMQAQSADTRRPRIVLASLSPEHCEPSMWLLAALLTADEIPAMMLEWEFPASELSLVLDQTDLEAAVFYSSQALPAHQLRRHLPRLSKRLPGQLFVAGPAAAIHQAEWHELGIIVLNSRASLAHQQLVAALQEKDHD